MKWLLLFFALSVSAQIPLPIVSSKRPAAAAGDSTFLQNPALLTGNMQLHTVTNLGTQSDGAIIDLAVRRWTNDASATGPNMYAYGTGLITNNAQNGMAGVWWGSIATACLIWDSSTTTISNYMAVLTCRIDSAQIGDNRVLSFGNAFAVVIDPTRTNWLSVIIHGDITYRFTNQFTRGVPFTFGLWRQGTNVVSWRETGMIGQTNAVGAQLQSTATYGIFGNAATGNQRPIGYQFDFLCNTNAALDGTNLPNVVYYHTNRFAIHP